MGNHLIRRYNLSSGFTTTIAGGTSIGYLDNSGLFARFNYPIGVTMDPAGTFAIVADSWNHLIRKCILSSGIVTTVAGNTSGIVGSDNMGYSDGTGTAATFNYPRGVAMNSAVTFVLIADRDNHLVRRLDLTTKLVTTLTGSLAGTIGSTNKGYSDGLGTAAAFQGPRSVAIATGGSFAIIVSGD